MFERAKVTRASIRCGNVVLHLNPPVLPSRAAHGRSPVSGRFRDPTAKPAIQRVRPKRGIHFTKSSGTSDAYRIATDTNIGVRREFQKTKSGVAQHSSVSTTKLVLGNSAASAKSAGGTNAADLAFFCTTVHSTVQSVHNSIIVHLYSLLFCNRKNQISRPNRYNRTELY